MGIFFNRTPLTPEQQAAKDAARAQRREKIKKALLVILGVIVFAAVVGGIFALKTGL